MDKDSCHAPLPDCLPPSGQLTSNGQQNSKKEVPHSASQQFRFKGKGKLNEVKVHSVQRGGGVARGKRCECGQRLRWHIVGNCKAINSNSRQCGRQRRIGSARKLNVYCITAHSTHTHTHTVLCVCVCGKGMVDSKPFRSPYCCTSGAQFLIVSSSLLLLRFILLLRFSFSLFFAFCLTDILAGLFSTFSSLR